MEEKIVNEGLIKKGIESVKDDIKKITDDTKEMGKNFKTNFKNRIKPKIDYFFGKTPSNITEEIECAKFEKELNKKAAVLLEGINFQDQSEVGLLNLKYSEMAEILREFNYDTAIFESFKDTKNYEAINNLKESINIAKIKIESPETLKEGYEELSQIFVGLVEKLQGPISVQYRNGGAAHELAVEKNGYEKMNQVNHDIKNFADHGGEENYQKLKKHGMTDKQIDSLMDRLYKDSKKK